MSDIIWQVLIGGFTILGALLILSVSIRQFTTYDAVSRVNALGSLTAPGIPLIAIGAFLGWTWQENFSWVLLLKTLVTIVAAMFVSSVATNVLARAAYMSGAPTDPNTVPNDLAEEPTLPGVPPNEPLPPEGDDH